jgi:hypothetical protein
MQRLAQFPILLIGFALLTGGISPERDKPTAWDPEPQQAMPQQLPTPPTDSLQAPPTPIPQSTQAPEDTTPGQVALIALIVAGVLTGWSFGLLAWGGLSVTWATFGQAFLAATAGGVVILLGAMLVVWLLQHSFLGVLLGKVWNRLAKRLVPRPRSFLEFLVLWPAMLAGVLIAAILWLCVVAVLFLSLLFLFGMVGATVSLLIMGYPVSLLAVLTITGALFSFFLFI